MISLVCKGFLSTFDDFNDELKKLKKLDRNNRWLSQPMDLMDDLIAMKGFLDGLVKKGVLNNKFVEKYLKSLANLNENLIGQMIVSQNSIKQPLGLLGVFFITFRFPTHWLLRQWLSYY